MDGRKRGSSDSYIPPELVEEILLNLPVKSLIRFSSVSKLWNSIIFLSRFIKKYRGDKMLVGPAVPPPTLTLSSILSDNPATTLSSILPDNPAHDATTIEGNLFLCASCDELLCVKVKTSMFLWNPSMRTYWKVRDPLLPWWKEGTCGFIFGLGFDAIGDDYKMLKIRWGKHPEAELYSMRSDSWRKTQPPPQTICHWDSYNGVFVNGTLHWFVVLRYDNSRIIISFHLSTEKYGQVVPPEYSPFRATGFASLTASRGKLCMFVDHPEPELRKLVMWTMEDYEVAQSWTKTFEISFDHGPMEYYCTNLTHLDGRILIKAFDLEKGASVLVLEGDKALSTDNFFMNLRDCFLHVESLVSPNMWLTKE